MILLLIVLVSIIIFALRTTLLGIKAGRLTGKAIKLAGKQGGKVVKATSNAVAKKFGRFRKGKSQLRQGLESAAKTSLQAGQFVLKTGISIAVNSYELTVKGLIALLRIIRGGLITVMGLIWILDLVVGFILILASAFYIMYLSDGTYKPTTSTNNGNTAVTSSQSSGGKKEESPSGEEVTTDNMGKNPYWATSEKSWKQSYANSKKLAKEVLGNWDKDYKGKITKDRKKILQTALDCYGVVNHYSQNSDRIHSYKEKPEPTDCSGFVTWVFSTLTKTSQADLGGFTGEMKSCGKWKEISRDELIPGDIAFMTSFGDYSSGSADHTGIFLGKDNSGNLVWVHCTSSENGTSYPKKGGVAVSVYDDFHYFGRYEKWAK